MKFYSKRFIPALKPLMLNCYLVIDYCYLVGNCFLIDIQTFDMDALTWGF